MGKTKESGLFEALEHAVIEERKMSINTIKRSGAEFYAHSSFICTDNEWIKNDDFVKEYIKYHETRYIDEFPEKYGVSKKHHQSHIHLQIKAILNVRLHLAIEKISLSKTDIKERKIIANSLFVNEQFQKAIRSARKHCGLSENFDSPVRCKDINDAEDFILAQLADVSPETSDDNITIQDTPLDNEIRHILKLFHLENEWSDFVCSVIACPNVFPHENFYLFKYHRANHTSVESVQAQYISIDIYRGITRKELDILYEALSPALSLEPIEDNPWYQVRNSKTRLYSDFLAGKSIEELMRQYYPDLDPSDYTNTNTIYHAIAREKKKRRIE